MLGLLRKYQKIIFAIVTVVIIVSFSFFGTYGAMSGNRVAIVDKIIGKGIDGSDIRELEIENLVKMIDTDANDMMILEGKGSANILNDGVVRKDIFESGFGKKIFNSYFKELKGETEERLLKFKAFKPYVHIDGVISVMSIYEQLMPSYAYDYNIFKKISCEGVSDDYFDVLSKLYVSKNAFPPHMIRRFLMFQQNQYGNTIHDDPYIANGDLSLFYAKTLSDWFGPRFVHLVANFIHNVAIFAKKQGYSVSAAEAKSSLMQIGMESLKKFDDKKNLSSEEFAKFFSHQIAILNMNESDAVKAWEKVLLFRKIMCDITNGVAVDSFLYKEFHKFASEGVNVELCKLPKIFNKVDIDKNFYKKLEIYVNAVSNCVDCLPVEFIDADLIKERISKLVQKRFLVNVAHITKKDVAKDIGLRVTWDFEVDDSNWEELSNKFPQLLDCSEKNGEARFAYLNSLNEKVRDEIDSYSRIKIVNQEMIKEKLASVKLESKEIVFYNDAKELIDGIKDNNKLIALLEAEQIGCEINYNENNDDFYKINIIDKSIDYEILTFEEAYNSGIFDEMVNSDIDVKVDRLCNYMKLQDLSVIKEFQALPKNNVLKLKNRIALENQWDVEKEEMKIMRKNNNHLFDNGIFEMEVGIWSDLICKDGLAPYFYRVVDRFVDLNKVSNYMDCGSKLLGGEACQLFVKNILNEMIVKARVLQEGKGSFNCKNEE